MSQMGRTDALGAAGNGGGRGRHRLAVVVLDGTLALDAAVAVQAFGPRPSSFHRIREEPEPPYELSFVGSPSSQLRSPCFSVGELRPFDCLEGAETVVVPGIDEPLRRREPEALAAIAAAAARGARLVSLCTGAFVLGHAGVLRGHRVTTHWALADDFRRTFPDVVLLDDELFVDDGQVLTSGGMLAAADLCLHILRTDLGQSYANDISRLLVSPPFRTGGQAQYRRRRAVATDGSLHALMRWALDHLDEPLNRSSLAAAANLSTRSLARRFEAEAGQGPMQWIAARRVERARALLEDTELSVTDVAFVTGFGSLPSFRRRFSQATGTTPSAYRDTFREGRAAAGGAVPGAGHAAGPAARSASRRAVETAAERGGARR